MQISKKLTKMYTLCIERYDNYIELSNSDLFHSQIVVLLKILITYYINIYYNNLFFLLWYISLFVYINHKIDQ